MDKDTMSKILAALDEQPRPVRKPREDEPLIPVDSVRAEYKYIEENCKGYKSVFQWLCVDEKTGKNCDEICIESESTGEKKYLYFDISSFYSRTKQSVLDFFKE